MRLNRALIIIMIEFIFILLLLFLSDYYDKGIAPGWGFFSKRIISGPMDGLVLIISSISIIISSLLLYRTLDETRKQSTLSIQPYLALSWVSNKVDDTQNRISQGIVDTCIIVKNEGKGPVRNIIYKKVSVNGTEVYVRNHGLISTGGSSVLVYKNSEEKEKLLGCRNDNRLPGSNDEIIKNPNNHILIKGKYRDILGGKYKFEFEKDGSEQSWFKERYIQKKIN